MPEDKTDTSSSGASKRRPMQLLLRIYGPQSDNLIDRDEELQILRRLARKRIGPRLLGTFSNGRFEEFLHAKTLEASDLRVPETSKQIAKRMRELHDGIDLLPSEIEKGPAIFINWDKCIDRCEKVITWLDAQVREAESGTEPQPKQAYTKYGLICGVEWPFFRQTYEKYKKRLVEDEYGGTKGLKKKLLFAHNDTQYGNLMRLVPTGESPLLHPVNQHKQLVVIDFEYAGQNTAGLEFANHFTEWCYNYHHPERSWACNTRMYPTVEEQHRFVRSYVMHRPQFNPSASATPHMDAKEKTNISDFMLDARAMVGAPAVDYDTEEKEREKNQEEEIQRLMQETRLWRIANSAHWITWGIVQAPIPELAERKSIATAVMDKIKDKLHPQSDPADEEVKEKQEAAKHDRPEGREQEEAHAEGEEEQHEEFDYLAYAQDRAMFFWGDCVQMGLVKEEDLPEKLRKMIRYVPY
jgi:choline kinase